MKMKLLLRWLKNLDLAFKLPINHFSAYSLMVEEKTLLAKQVANNELVLPDDSMVEFQYTTLINKVKSAYYWVMVPGLNGRKQSSHLWLW